MLVTLPFLVWIAFVGLSAIAPHGRLNPQWDWRDSFTEASLGWAVVLFAVTEFLSALGQLTRTGLVIGWGAILIAAGVWLALSRARQLREIMGRSKIPGRGKRLEAHLILMLAAVSGVAILTALMALLDPPSGSDTLAYHMGRVVHWVQNRSVAHYATPDSRQVWMPPWAEYAMLHLFVLAGSDRLANMVQWFSLVGMILVASRIAGLMRATRTGQVFTAVFIASLAPAVVQASGADTDVVAAFWVVCVGWVLLRFGSGRAGWEGWGLAGAAVGLGALTKGTSVVYSLPLILWFAALQLRRYGWIQWFARSLAAGLIVGVLVGPMWARNWASFGSFLGPREHLELLGNVSLGPMPLLSNLVRNVSTDLATPWDRLNEAIARGVLAVHHTLRLDASDPTTTFAGRSYGLGWIWPGSNSAPLHFGLGVLATVVLLIRDHEIDRRRALGLALSALLGLMLFGAIFKWQGAMRFQIPAFVLMAPVVGLWLGTWRIGWLAAVVATPLLIAVIPTLIFDPWRPFVPIPPRTSASGVFTTPRLELYFRATGDLWPVYRAVARQVQSSGCRQVALRSDSHEREYLWWIMLRPWDREMRIEHLLIFPGLEKYVDPTFKPCAVICTVCTENSNPLPGVVGEDMGKKVWLYLISPPPGANPLGP